MINTNTASVKYARKINESLCQYLVKNDAVTNFPVSRAEAIITTGINAPAKRLPNPETEKKAATPLMIKAVDNSKIRKFIILNVSCEFDTLSRCYKTHLVFLTRRIETVILPRNKNIVL